MKIIYLEEALSDIEFWKKSGNVQVQKKIQQLVDDITKTPFDGLGKPEPLKHKLKGKWSRRITDEDRLVYNIEDMCIKIYSLRGHY